jgi:hypothetical protein
MRNDALLMDLADCGSPETLVAAILRIILISPVACQS